MYLEISLNLVYLLIGIKSLFNITCELIIICIPAEILNADTKLYIESYSNSEKLKILNIALSPQTNERN